MDHVGSITVPLFMKKASVSFIPISGYTDGDYWQKNTEEIIMMNDTGYSLPTSLVKDDDEIPHQISQKS